MSDLVYVSESNFHHDVIASDIPVLVDFTAAWCAPCKMLDPIVRQLAQAWAGKVKIVKVDADEAVNLTMQYQVMSLPTLILFVKGEPVQRVFGYQPKDRLLAKFGSHLPAGVGK